MSSESWKLEKDLCRCCHSEGSFKNLAEPAQSGGLAEIYADMLNECFDIDMAPVPGLLSAATYTICEICVIRLRDASEFKKQVLTCEERFKDLYNKNIIRVPFLTSYLPKFPKRELHKHTASTTLIDVEVKQEIPEAEVEPRDAFKVEISQDDNDDEDYNESIDIQISEDEEEVKPVKVEVTKKRKCKTKKTVKCKPTKKTKRKNVKVDTADEENDAEKKQGQDMGPKISLKIEEDYKKIDKRYHCTRCEKTYGDLRTMTTHVSIKHFNMPRYKCSICNDPFTDLVPLTIHKLEVHNVDVRKTCGLCNQIFNLKAHLTRHIKDFHMLGETGKRYKCKLCDYVTFKLKNMRKHKVVHKTVKNYHCKFCKKSFKRKTTLDFHERIHTGDRRKVCAECGQAFVQKASLNYHMTKYHPHVNF